MLELDEALTRILAVLPAPVVERVPLKLAWLRIAAEEVLAKIDLPRFDNSSMDGYAVRAADVSRVTAQAPARLRLAGRVAAGESFAGRVPEGTCVRLFTGSPLPAGADAVVMQEDTRTEGEDVLVLEPARPWENVRLQGEDVKKGQALLAIGDVITASRLALLAATGSAEVRVGRRPTVGVLATGSELREPGEHAPLGAGQLYESNRLVLATLVEAAGGRPKVFPLVQDNLNATRSALTEAFAECDCVVTSGGVSVGEMDFVKRAFEQDGGELQFWKVSIKPGKPFVFGSRQGKFLFGLPGNPVSAFVTFLLLVRPALLRWQGAMELPLPSHPGRLAEPLNNPGDRRHFFRVKIDADGNVFSVGVQASHVFSSLAAANGLVDVPPRTILGPGTGVKVMRWD